MDESTLPAGTPLPTPWRVPRRRGSGFFQCHDELWGCVWARYPDGHTNHSRGENMNLILPTIPLMIWEYHDPDLISEPVAYVSLDDYGKTRYWYWESSHLIEAIPGEVLVVDVRGATAGAPTYSELEDWKNRENNK